MLYFAGKWHLNEKTVKSSKWYELYQAKLEEFNKHIETAKSSVKRD
jgi:hypothetical protein